MYPRRTPDLSWVRHTCLTHIRPLTGPNASLGIVVQGFPDLLARSGSVGLLCCYSIASSITVGVLLIYQLIVNTGGQVIIARSTRNFTTNFTINFSTQRFALIHRIHHMRELHVWFVIDIYLGEGGVRDEELALSLISLSLRPRPPTALRLPPITAAMPYPFSSVILAIGWVGGWGLRLKSSIRIKRTPPDVLSFLLAPSNLSTTP